MNQQYIIVTLIFVMVFFVVVVGFFFFSPNQARKRVIKFTAQKNRQSEKSEFFDKVVNIADPLVKLSLPDEGWENSALERKFVNAGWRDTSYPNLFFALKTCLAIILPAIAFVLLQQGLSDGSDKSLLLLILLLSASLGYYLPNIILNGAVKNRKLEISDNFPDALDLLTVCVEAGLSFDQALSKVSTEIKMKSESLANDLQLVLVEMRAGYSRERALRNLSLRTGVEEVESLATLVIQSERFGTSIGDSLRVQAENLRHKRKIKAEEMSAKLSVKLLLPLTVCIFPVFFIVVLGPAAIQVIRTLSQTM